MEIIKIIIAALVFALSYCIWRKIVDRADEFLRKRMSDRTYDIVTWSAIIIIFGAFFYTLFK